MSWLSDTIDKARKEVDRIGDKSTEVLPKSWRGGGRKAFRYGAASMGGGMGLQYEYSRDKGMNSDEATKNALAGGAQYEQVRGAQKQRIAEDAAKEQEAAFERRRLAEEARARGQIAVRIRRGLRDSSSRAGTTATPAGGLGTTGGFGAFAALLGL